MQFQASAPVLTPPEAVEAQLRRCGYSQLREIRALDVDGCIRLTGRVTTYYLKQMAQTTALTVPGVEAVENELVVT